MIFIGTRVEVTIPNMSESLNRRSSSDLLASIPSLDDARKGVRRTRRSDGVLRVRENERRKCERRYLRRSTAAETDRESGAAASVVRNS